MIGGAEDHRVVTSKKIFSGKIFQVFVDDVELPTGKIVKRESVKHPGAVGMVPVTPDGEVILVRQYRYPTGEDVLEIPAGKLDIAGESPEGCALRELSEEVGFHSDRLIKLAEFYNSPGYSSEYFYLYLAHELRPASGSPDAEEFLEIERFDLAQTPVMISKGEIQDAKTIIGVLLARMYLEGSYSPVSVDR